MCAGALLFTISWAIKNYFQTTSCSVNVYEEINIIYVGSGINLVLNECLHSLGVTAPEYYVRQWQQEIVLLLLEYVLFEIWNVQWADSAYVLKKIYCFTHWFCAKLHLL